MTQRGPMKVTIDTNCIIDLEEERDSAQHIRLLMRYHAEGSVQLQVVAIGASERKPDGTYASNFSEFVEKLTAVGLGSVGILKPMGYWGVSFWGQGLWTNDEMVEFERKIHEVLFPEVEFKYEDYCRTRGIETDPNERIDPRWRNAKCDVLALWSHIHHGGGIFVTSDLNFHKQSKKPALITLGAGSILTPREAARRLS